MAKKAQQHAQTRATPRPLATPAARLLRPLRAPLAALGGLAPPGGRPGRWAPSHCLGCAS